MQFRRSRRYAALVQHLDWVFADEVRGFAGSGWGRIRLFVKIRIKRCRGVSMKLITRSPTIWTWRFGRAGRVAGRCGILLSGLGVSRSTLYRRAKEINLEPREPQKRSYYYRRPKVYDHAHPLVKDFFEEARRQRVNLTQIAAASGVSRETINSWGNHSSPLLVNFEAAANYLGLELRVSVVRTS